MDKQKETKKPIFEKISAIIPTYNRASYIRDAIESVLAQTYPIYEIIVVDDGSTDNTSEIIRLYGDKIRYSWQQNSGPGAARNSGIKAAKGDYIAFLDSDDIWVQNKTKIQMEFVGRHPHLDIVFGDMANFSETEDNNMPEIKNPKIHDYLIAHSSYIEQIFDCLIMVNLIPTPTVICKRACISQIGFFNEKLKIAEDYDFWLRAAARNCCFGFINAVLVKRRRHDDNLVNDWASMKIAGLDVLNKFEKEMLNLTARTQRTIADKLYLTHYDLGSYYFNKRDFAMALKYLKKGVPKKLINAKWFIKLLVSFIMQKHNPRGIVKEKLNR